MMMDNHTTCRKDMSTVRKFSRNVNTPVVRFQQLPVVVITVVVVVFLWMFDLYDIRPRRNNQSNNHWNYHVESIRILPNEWMNIKKNKNTTTLTHGRSRRQLQELLQQQQQQQQQQQRHIASTPVNVPTSPNDHLVESLPLLDMTSFTTTKQWAGHLPASSNGDKYFFYWLFEPDVTTTTTATTTTTTHNNIVDENIPIILWLNGGPACSSMDGLFIENGPFQFNVDPQTGKYRLTPNPYSWHKAPAYTLYIDQPVGTGLSFTTSGLYPTNDQEVNVDFYYFLQQFFTLHRDKFVNTNLETTRKLYFSGESYAGHYIPSIMNYLLKKKSTLSSSSSTSSTSTRDSKEIIISVAGGAIGNGWTDPFYQYAGAEFAYGHSMIGIAQVLALQEKEKLCQAKLNMGQYSVSICFDLIDDIIAASFGSGSMYKASGYDVRKAELRSGEREFPPGHKIIETYLGGWDTPSNAKGKISNKIYTKVLEAIHATAATTAGQVYQECTDPPYNALAGNDGKGVVDDVVEILQHSDKVQLLFFNGVHDIICNHVGNEKFLEKLPWEHAKDWYASHRYVWIASTETPGKVSGYIKEYENLRFLKVLDAGHMVPMDVPNVALDMMKIFVSNGSFNSNKQDLEGRTENTGSCPICPTCLERDSGGAGTDTQNDHEQSQYSPPEGTVMISYTWLIVGSVILAISFILLLIRRPRNATLMTTARHQPVPQYELELRDTKTSYHDEDDNHHVNTSNGLTIT